MKKLLIAASSQIFAEALTEILSEQYDIAVCYDGWDALQQLQEYRPDLLVIDMYLTGIDGVGVLKTAHSSGLLPKVLACTTYITDYVTANLAQMQICDLIRLPCDIHQFAARVLEVDAWQEDTSQLDTELQSLLAVLGFKVNHAGCVVTGACLKQYLIDPHQPLCSQLYPAVAQQLGGTDKSVERAMGRAIEAAWKGRDERIWRLYFPTGKNGKVAKPSNAQFMARIADCLKCDTETEAKSLIG